MVITPVINIKIFTHNNPVKTYLFTIGLHEDFAIRRLMATNVTKEDVVVALIKSPISNGNKRAINALNAVLSKMGLREAIVKEVEVSGELFHVIERVINVINCFKDPLVVDVSGSESRVLAVAVILALVITKRAGKVYVEEEDEEYYFSVEEARTAVEGLSKELLVMLHYIVKEPGIRHEEIAERTGKKLKTVMNIVGVLKRKKLVYQKGRGGGIYPTRLGVVISMSERRD